MKKWYLPSEKMPNIGDRIIAQDWSGEEMEIIIKNIPEQPYNGNVCKWRYVDE